MYRIIYIDAYRVGWLQFKHKYYVKYLEAKIYYIFLFKIVVLCCIINNVAFE